MCALVLLRLCAIQIANEWLLLCPPPSTLCHRLPHACIECTASTRARVFAPALHLHIDALQVCGYRLAQLV